VAGEKPSPVAFLAAGLKLRIMSKALAIIGVLVLGSCTHTYPVGTPRATDVPLVRAQPEYWYEQPAVVAVADSDFQPLWDACAKAARERLFVIDRQDYRDGVLTTQPMVSKQFFEIWRNDTPLISDVGRNSLQTLRRTIRWEVIHQEDGLYLAYPKVLIERQSFAGYRITNAADYQSAFTIDSTITGSREEDQGKDVRPNYWYPIGRDEHLERDLAQDVQELLHEK